MNNTPERLYNLGVALVATLQTWMEAPATGGDTADAASEHIAQLSRVIDRLETRVAQNVDETWQVLAMAAMHDLLVCKREGLRGLL